MDMIPADQEMIHSFLSNFDVRLVTLIKRNFIK
jgi:hypothetical protein